MSTYLYHDGHTKMILDEPFFQRLTLGTGLIEWDFSENDEMKRLTIRMNIIGILP